MRGAATFDLCTAGNPKQNVVNTATRLTSISSRRRPSTHVWIMQSAVAAFNVAADAPTAKGCARANAVTDSAGRDNAIINASACSVSMRPRLVVSSWRSGE